MKLTRTEPVLPIPAMSSKQLDERRTVKHQPSLVDRVERAIKDVLLANEAYLKLVAGISNADSAEGTIMDDNVLAAAMVREAGVDLGDEALAEETTQAIRRAQSFALRRFNISRNQRAAAIARGDAGTFFKAINGNGADHGETK